MRRWEAGLGCLIFSIPSQIGLLKNTACKNPQKRNLDAIFIDTVRNVCELNMHNHSFNRLYIL